MNKQISKEQYVLIDMLILTIIMCVLEWASTIALDIFPKELFVFSIVLPITLIAMMRHGKVGAITGAIGGLVCCIVNAAQWDVYLIYILGNSFIVFNLLWFRKQGKEKIRQDVTLIILYVVSGYVLMNFGRGILALILGYRPFIETMIRYFTTDTLSAIMAVIIVLIARRQNGVFEDQMTYLVRLQTEEEQRNERKA